MQREQMNRGTAGNTAGILTALLLFLCILSVAYYTYSRSINPDVTPMDLLRALTGGFDPVAKDALVEYGFEFDSEEMPEFATFGDYIAKCSVGGIWFLDKKGGTVWSEAVSLNKPIIKTSGSRLLVADSGASELIVVEGREKSWEEHLDESILNADISRNGYVAVIVTSKRYNNEIRVFDPYGVELFRKIIATDFAVNAGVSPAQDLLAVSGISTGAYGAYSDYKFYDFDGNEPAVQTFETSGELLPLFWFNNDGSLFAAGDKAVAAMDKSGRTIWEKKFTGVTGACPAGDGKLAVAEESSGGTQLILYDTQGKETASGKLSFKPRGISAVKGAIAAYTSDTVYFFDDRCRNFCKYSSDSPIRKVIFFNRQQAAVITSDTIKVVNIS